MHLELQAPSSQLVFSKGTKETQPPGERKLGGGVGPTHPAHCRGHYKCPCETCCSTALRSGGHSCVDAMGEYGAGKRGAPC